MAGIRRLVSLCAALSLVAAMVVLAPTTVGAEPTEELDWLTLGDSYSAGVGHNGGGLGVAYFSNKCRRQKDGYSGEAQRIVIDEVAISRSRNEACLGAGTRHYWNDQGGSGPFRDDVDAQSERVRETDDLVVLTLGGNDIGFADAVIDCAGLEFVQLRDPSTGCDYFSPDAIDFDRLEDRLVDVYTDIRDRMAPDGHLFVLSYPKLFADPDLWRSDVCERVNRTDAREMNQTAERLRDSIGEAVAAAERVVGNVHFVDVVDGFENRGLCRPGYESFIRGLSFPAVTDSFHPSSLGYEQMAQTLADCVADVLVDQTTCDGSRVPPLTPESSGSSGWPNPIRAIARIIPKFW